MSRPALSSPIAVVVDRAQRAAAASPADERQAAVQDSAGRDFVQKYFGTARVLVNALQSELFDIVHTPAIAKHLSESLSQQILNDYGRDPHGVAQDLVNYLSQPQQIDLRKAILAYLKSRSRCGCYFKTHVHDEARAENPVRPLPSPLSECLGRKEEVQGIEEALLKEGALKPAVVLGGAGGIGKTTLALTVLNGDKVKGRFGGSRFWISCETALTAEGFLGTVLATLSTSSSFASLFSQPLDTIDETFHGLLDRLPQAGDPAVVAVDNLETIFDVEPSLVERILCVILRSAAIIVTIRGQQRPYIARQWTWPSEVGAYIEPLAEETWFDALQSHAGGHLPDADRPAAQSLLRQLAGHPLAISLVGRQIAQCKWSAKDLEKAWRAEVSRKDGLRGECLSTSIRISLASPTIAESPGAIELLVLAAYLPPGFSDVPFLRWLGVPNGANGLPKWLAQVLCGTDLATAPAWSALIRCGLAYSHEESPDHLQLLPPIQETLRHHESIARLSPSMQTAIGDTLESAFAANDYLIDWNLSDTGEFGRHAKLSLECSGTLAPAPLYSRSTASQETTASSAYLLGQLCQHAGFRSSASLLFEEARRRYGMSDRSRKAILAHASHMRIEAERAREEDRLVDALHYRDKEAPLWDSVDLPTNAALARARGLNHQAHLDEAADRLEEAACHRDAEAEQWALAGRSGFANQSRAGACDLRSRLAEREGRLEEAAQYRDQEAAFWDAVNMWMKPDRSRAQACGLRADLAEREGRLEDAARYRDEETDRWTSLGRHHLAKQRRRQAKKLRAEARGSEYEGSTSSEEAGARSSFPFLPSEAWPWDEASEADRESRERSSLLGMTRDDEQSLTWWKMCCGCLR